MSMENYPLPRSRGSDRLSAACVVSGLLLSFASLSVAQPQMVDQNLQVRSIVSGLVTPTSMAFLSADDLLVLEKGSGQVKRVVNGAIHSTVLDLPVNSASERGLLGIALHPNFPATPLIVPIPTRIPAGSARTIPHPVPLAQPSIPTDSLSAHGRRPPRPHLLR